MKRVADYIAEFIYDSGVQHVFLLSGGGMMYLTDGLAKHPKIKVVCFHHEQALTMAAVGYAKYKKSPSCVYATTGCGGTNTVTGLLDAWQDNVPVLFISGQSKRKETVRNSGLNLRQFGVQEADIIPVVQSLTKYAVMVNDPEEVPYHLEKALHLATTGRRGPVWVDVPMDVQSAQIDTAKAKHFSPQEMAPEYKTMPTSDEMAVVVNALKKAQRPIFIAGQGIVLAKAVDEFKSLIESKNIPFVASRLGIEILPGKHPLFIGRIGNKGDRAGNFAVQNADLIIAVGSRLSVSSTGHEYATFGREAKIIVVDIDPIEHKKNTVRIDHFVNADAKEFLRQLGAVSMRASASWTEKCLHWKDKWPVNIPAYSADPHALVNMYYFVDRMSHYATNATTFVSDAGSSFYVVSQAVMLKEGQRYVTSGGQADMGFGLPAALGVAIAQNGGQVLAVTGDGSLQLNIQELQTLRARNLPVKLFVWNNDGYLSIRATQKKFFEGRYVGTDSLSGVTFPELKKITEAYGLPYFKIGNTADVNEALPRILAQPGPAVCEVMCIRDQEVAPIVSSTTNKEGRLVSKPLEDMYPYMSREEFRSEMIVKPLDE